MTFCLYIEGMLRRIKTFLGIEGVRLTIIVNDQLDLPQNTIAGSIECRTIHPQHIHTVVIQLVEVYKRGRGSSKRIDEYILGQQIIPVQLEIQQREVIEVPFDFLIERQHSPMDRWQQKNVASHAIGQAAKWINNTKSTFFLRAQAQAEGTALSPFTELEIEV